MFTVDVKQYNNDTTTQNLLQINDLHWVLGCNYLGAINLTLGWFSNKRKFYHAVKQLLFYSMVKFPFIGECYNIRRPTSSWRLWYIRWYIQGLCSQLSESWHLGEEGGGQSLFKQSWSQGGHASSEDIKDAAEFDVSRGIRTAESEHPYILNECQLHGWHEKGVQSFVSRSKLCPPTPTSPMHGVTSHVQVKDPVCSVVTLLHGGSSCRYDSLYFNLRKCNIFVTKLSIYTWLNK